MRYLTSVLRAQTLKNPKIGHLNEENARIKVKLGLEIHARILTKSKIFSDSNSLGLKVIPANTSVSFFDASLPGTMPTLNEASVKAALVSALALNCKINTVSYFERKHYFYSDLPAGYQITQQKRPIAFDGNIVYPVSNPQTHVVSYKTAKIRRIQLEHDSARTLQTDNLSFELNKNMKIKQNALLIDLNRAGVGLMEIVTEPVFEEAFDVYSFVRELSLVLREINTCETIMDDGGFRVDVNVSVHRLRPSNNPKEEAEVLPGVRVELKNLATFNEILKATEYEIKRQKQMLQNNETINMETRTYDSRTKKTVAIRSKEDQYDYRFMPEPNLLPLVVLPSKTKLNDNHELVQLNEMSFSEKELIKSCQQNFVDFDEAKKIFSQKILPQSRRDKLVKEFGMTDKKAFVFVANDLDYIFYEIFRISKILDKNNEQDNKLCVKVLINEYLNQINSNSNIVSVDFDLKCKKIVSYIELLKNQIISKRICIKFFSTLFEVENINKVANDIAKENSWFIINDPEIITRALNDLFEENTKTIDEYKSTPKKRTKIFDYFVGKLHKKLNECASPEMVDEIVLKSLKNLE